MKKIPKKDPNEIIKEAFQDLEELMELYNWLNSIDWDYKGE